MKQYWSEGELVEFWTLTGVERQLSDQRTQRGVNPTLLSLGAIRRKNRQMKELSDDLLRT